MNDFISVKVCVSKKEVDDCLISISSIRFISRLEDGKSLISVGVTDFAVDESFDSVSYRLRNFNCNFV